jgi:SAM-dependent methyltransferase
MRRLLDELAGDDESGGPMKFPLILRRKADAAFRAQSERINKLKGELEKSRETAARYKQKAADKENEAAGLRATMDSMKAYSLVLRPALHPDLRIQVTRGDRVWEILPAEFETYPFESGDRLVVTPPDLAAWYPVTWDDVCLEIEKGRSIRVPPVMNYFEYRGYRIPSHLISLVGSGPETFVEMGKGHVAECERVMGPFSPDMHVLDMGCGIGRAAFQYMEVLGENGAYTGIDVTRDSIEWCRQHITPHHPNYRFHHFDAENELYNPYGTQLTRDYRLPLEDGTVDRIALFSVFTHLFEEETQHYLHEFRRILRPGGLIYASFYHYSPEAIEAARTKGNTPWKATFSHPFGNGFYGNDPTYPRGAVAFTDEALRRMLRNAGLALAKPYINGNWSGLHPDAKPGQDGAVIGLADS